MTVTKNTPWRNIGAVPYAIWRKSILDAGGTPAVAEKSVWAAYRDDSALALSFLKRESSYASDYDLNPESNRNPWNLQYPDPPRRFLKFISYEEGARAWRERLYSETYKGGVYARTSTILQLISTYAPKSDGNDPDGYSEEVSEIINRNGITKEVPVALTFGKVPHPTHSKRIITNSTAWNNLGQRQGRAVVWHRMYGTLWGTDTYFRGEALNKALTDYGVGVSATDGASQAGVILMWNDPFGNRSPYASGPVQNPIDDGKKFVDLYGVSAVNRDGISIEISGNGGTALDAKARASVVALTAYYADQYGKRLAAAGKQFDHTTFPYIPSENNRSFVCYHGEFYDGKRLSCPGAVVTAATDGMIAEVRAILKKYQTDVPVEPGDGEEEPVYATPKKPKAGDFIENDRIFLAHAAEYTLKTDATPRIYADPGSDPTGPVLKKGTKIKTTHVVSDKGESADLTAIIEDGSRVAIKGAIV